MSTKNEVQDHEDKGKRHKRTILQKLSAFSIPVDVWSIFCILVISACAMYLYVKLIIPLSFWLAWWFGALVAMFPFMVLGLIIAGLLIKIDRKKPAEERRRIISFYNVTAMHALVLRWRFNPTQPDWGALDQTPDVKLTYKKLRYDPRKDTDVYIGLPAGLVVYIPWLYVLEKELDIQPIVMKFTQAEGKATAVNAKNGSVIGVDSVMTVSIVDPVAFYLNVGDRDKIREIVEAYLETALQRITSAGPSTIDESSGRKCPRVNLPSYDHTKSDQWNKEYGSVEGWVCSDVALSDSSDEEHRRMGGVASAWMNHWMSAGREEGETEQNFGLYLKVKINTFGLPETVLSAQESLSAATLHAKERGIDAEADQLAMKKLFNFDDEKKPDPTVLAVASIMFQGITNLATQLLGGERAAGKKLTHPQENGS